MDDPLAGITLQEEDYHWVTQETCAVAERVSRAHPNPLRCFIADALVFVSAWRRFLLASVATVGSMLRVIPSFAFFRPFFRLIHAMGWEHSSFAVM